MSSHLHIKLKTLQHLLTSSAIVTQPWLDVHGINRKLSRKYVENGWLERIGNGAFKRSGSDVSWMMALNAIQKQLKLPVHIGAKSALEIKGGSHYLKLSEVDNEVFLFSPSKIQRLPKWFRDQDWGPSFTLVRTSLLPEDFTNGLSEVKLEGPEVLVASKEQAIMELLYLLPKMQTWDEANLIFENLATLRPKLIQTLLENCSSIKVKRLFLFFAQKHDHQWFRKLDLNKIDLGAGDRMLHKGGSYEKKYRITVPKNLSSKES